MMKYLLLTSLEQHTPIVIMYMTSDRVITDRLVIVRHIHDDWIKAYCFKRGGMRTFKRENIIAADWPRRNKPAQ